MTYCGSVSGVPAGVEITFPSGATTAFATQMLCARNRPGRNRLRRNLACGVSPVLNAESHCSQIVVSSCSVRAAWLVAWIALLRATDEAETASLSADDHWLA